MKNNLINFIKNKKIKKSLMLISSILALNLVATNIFASLWDDFNKNSKVAQRVNIEREGNYMTKVVAKDYTPFSTYVKRAESGELALCLEHIKPAPTSIMYTKDTKFTDKGYKHIYLAEPNSGDSDTDYYIKQLALNYYQGDVSWLDGEVIRGEDIKDEAIALAREARKVQNGTKESQYFRKSSISATPLNTEFELIGDYYVTDWFNVSKTSNLQSYSLEFKNAPKGIEILNSSGAVVNELSSNDTKFKLRVPKNNVKNSYKNLQVRLKGNFLDDQMYLYLPDDETYQKVMIANEEEIALYSLDRVVLEIEALGGIDLVKTSDQGGRLGDAEFELRKNGVAVATGKTNANGEISFSDLEVGQYELVEIKAPTGYVLNTNPVAVNVMGGVNTPVNITNDIIKGRVAVEKFDSEIDTLKLQGAEFTIYNMLGDIVDTIITDENGYAESKLLNYGSYVMRETGLPTGYKGDTSLSYNIQITENNKIYKYDIQNDVYKGKIHIVKIDAQNEEVPVKGAGFDVIAENVPGIASNTLIEHITTNEDGFAYSGELRYGLYKLVETVVPDKFWESGKEYFVNITEDGKTYVRYIKNDAIQSKIRVIKTDGVDKKILEGVKFKIRNKDRNEDIVFKEYIGGKVVDKIVFTTNEFGEFVTPQELGIGNYELVEVEGLEGYVLAEPIDFTIDKNTSMEDVELIGKVMSLNVENQRIKSNFKLTKVDEYTKEPLEGVEFRIECIDGFNKGTFYRLITDSLGEATINNLEYGKYEIVELKTVEGYVLNEEPITFEVKENNKDIEIEISNKPIEGYIEINKVDEDTKRKLKDVKFEVWNKFRTLVAVLTTDENGYVKTEKLPYGVYYIKEQESPDGYRLNEDNIETVGISEEGQVHVLNITNKRQEGILQFSKTDIATGEVIEGATIEIKGLDEINKDVYIKFVSSKKGNKFTLPVGKYEIKETIAPESYILSEEVGTFEIKEDGEIVKAEIKNKKKEVASVVDEPTKKPITGDFIYYNMAIVLLAGIALLKLNKK